MFHLKNYGGQSTAISNLIGDVVQMKKTFNIYLCKLYLMNYRW